MKKDKLHDIPKVFPDNERKVKPQTKEERKESLKKLLNIMLELQEIDKNTYEEMYKEGIEEIEKEFNTK